MICPFCQAENAGSESCAECGHALQGSAVVRRGTLVRGRYEVLNPVGRGGMGMVYKAHDRLLDEVIALKVLRPDLGSDPDAARRFRMEFKLARRVRHRNVCALYDYEEDGGLRFICMEHVDGIDVKQLLRRRLLDRAEAYDVALQAAEGLQAIHEAGVIHRDLKTANIMRTARGVVRLMDFGIAKQWGAEATATGQVMGTPEYLSPEQARGERVDFRSDVYSLGVVVFEIFAGEVPFRGESAVSVIFKHLQAAPPLDDPSLPERLRPVLGRALAKEPSRRFATAGEMADALAEVAAEASGDTRPLAPATRRLPVAGLETRSVDLTLTGDLRTMAMEDVLQWIARGKKSGTLEVERRTVVKKLSFREGMLSSSWSNNPRESLGQYLVREQLLTEEELFKALLRQEDQGRLLGEILVEEGLLGEEELRVCLREKAEQSVYDLFLWPEGRFAFKDGEQPTPAGFALSLSVEAVLAEGSRRREEWNAIRRVIPSLQVTFEPRGDHRPPPGTPSERAYELAAAGRSLGEIALETHRSDFEVASVLYGLCLDGALAVGQVGDEVQVAETVGAIHDLLEIASARLKERRYDGALEAYEAVLALDPLNQQAKKGLIAVSEARERERARKTIPLGKVPVLKRDLVALSREAFDPGEAFLLTRLNGRWNVQALLKLCPMAEEDALLTFARLLDRRVIELRDSAS